MSIGAGAIYVEACNKFHSVSRIIDRNSIQTSQFIHLLAGIYHGVGGKFPVEVPQSLDLFGGPKCVTEAVWCVHNL